MQGYLADEIRVANKINAAPEDSLLKRIDTFSKKSKDLNMFSHFKSIPKSILTMPNLTEEDITELINQPSTKKEIVTLLLDRILEVESVLNELQLINRTSEGGYSLRGVSKDILDDIEKLRGKSKESQYTHVLEQLTYIQLIGMFEQGKLLFGDFGAYTDLFKRTKGVVGAKKYPVASKSFTEWMQTNRPYRGYVGRSYLNENGETASIRSIVRNDIKVDSQYINQYKAIFSILRPEFDQSILDEAYLGIDEFDGGGIITLDSYRRLLNHVSQWTTRQENLYQKIMNGEETTPGDLAYFPPLKPQVFAPLYAENVELRTFHKFALFPVHPELTRVIGDEEGYGNKTLDLAYADMINNHIDYQVFNSVAKIY